MFKSLLLKGRTLCLLLCCLVSSLVVNAQTKHTGKVTGSDDKLPVVGASVRVKGTTIGTQTDVNGQFSINVNPGDVLVISYLGYQSNEVTVGASETVNVALQAGNNSLNEVVVTGYTTQRKKDISGSVTTVNVAAAKSVPSVSSETMLQGQAAGVNVVTQGAPGAGAQVTIRGLSNFGSSSPLYVIDGLQTGSMSNVNPNDIESISVLKDAGAAAIYGVSGGNGVIVVTTKKGKQGKATISYDAFYGTTQPLGGNVFNTLNADQFEQLLVKTDPGNALLIGSKIADYGYQSGGGSKGVFNQANASTFLPNYHLDNDPSRDYLIQKFAKGAGTDWFHEIFKSAPIQQHSLSASGASDKSAYFLSLGYSNQQGTLIGTYFKRYQARVNTTFSVKDHIRLGENISYSYIASPNGAGGLPNGGNQNEGNSISETYRTLPIIPVRDIAGNLGGTYAGPAALGNALNPVGIQERQKTTHSNQYGLQGTVFAEADILKHFTARTAYSADISNNYYYNIGYRQYDSGEAHGGNNSYSEGSSYNSSFNWSNTINYKQVFGKHSISVLAGYEQRGYTGRNINANAINLFSLDPFYANISNGQASKTTANSQFNGLNTIQSLFGRLDYTFNDRYIIGATVRRDGSSVFSSGRKYGTFPAVSAAWRVTQEEFAKGSTWLNDLKIRGSYGTSGYNGNVGANSAYTAFGGGPGSSSYPITGSSSAVLPGYYLTSLGNDKTTWETDKTFNIGFDASLFNHLDLSIEYYKKTISNLLVNVPISALAGGYEGAWPAVNNGVVVNNGLDMSATYHGSTSGVTYSIGANVTTLKNKITELGAPFFTSGIRNGSVVYNQVGGSIGQFYGYKVQGYWNTQAEIDALNAKQKPDLFGSVPVYQTDAAPGRFRYDDVNGDGRITDADRTKIGNPTPDFTYGVNLNVAYKGFDLGAILYGSHGGDIYNTVKYWTNFYGSQTGNKSLDLLNNSWDPTKTAAQNANAKTPVIEKTTNFSTADAINSYYVESGSFLKLKSVIVGYTFAPNLLKSVGVDKLRVYVQGTNLFTATKYSGLDPELQAADGRNSQGVDLGNYPNNERRFIFGVNLSF
ncbi:TonB-dependent receptor [Mucilaginibacter sp. RB4R14]|uniref:SusC/RagA family TonB-linked outer membrane protein n=1 Tax=Mucilaginibacter aurantiaciroseus TaxID=2949308 RepID=UPI0020911D3E|nr:TonB-dependent receptor [Mucilaginibacter aurantiaciroseus]MCO5936330.1 TonB-dependent receptor [Mucilaginibacter aurantiaciroseus]